MLKAVRRGLFSTKYEIIDGEAAVGVIAMGFASESAEIEIEGSIYKAYREGFLHGAFLFRSEEAGVLASAEKPSAFERSFRVSFDDQIYTLEAESPIFRKFVLLENNSVVGSISPDGILTAESTIDLPAKFPVHIQAFMFWLVALLWKRASDTVAAGSN